jgi:hypothetical protein
MNLNPDCAAANYGGSKNLAATLVSLRFFNPRYIVYCTIWFNLLKDLGRQGTIISNRRKSTLPPVTLKKSIGFLWITTIVGFYQASYEKFDEAFIERLDTIYAKKHGYGIGDLYSLKLPNPGYRWGISLFTW